MDGAARVTPTLGRDSAGPVPYGPRREKRRAATSAARPVRKAHGQCVSRVQPKV